MIGIKGNKNERIEKRRREEGIEIKVIAKKEQEKE